MDFNKTGRIAAHFLELSGESLDLPKITLLENRCAFIQNHRGIMEYSTEIIRLRTKQGEILINGNGLSLDSALRDELTVRGNIAKIEFVDWKETR